MLRAHRLAKLFLVSLPLAGCVSAPTSRPGAPLMFEQAVITAQDIERTGAVNLYEAIMRTRPLFVATRGATSIVGQPRDGIVVIVNDLWIGGVGELERISVANVRTIRRMSAVEVYHRTGRSAPGGAIAVTLGR